MNEILKILEENPRYTNEEIGVMVNKPTKEVDRVIRQLEKEGVICGYAAILDRDRMDDNFVEAVIELKVTPKKDFGFDEIADKISQYDEVEDVNLMSGTYDLSLTVTGKSFKDIALFVSQRLATLDSVVSTATHFVLSRYKEKGIIKHEYKADERGNASIWLIMKN